MKTTKLHTLEEVLTTGITVDEQSEPIKISCIFIPKIQRSYAQGRKTENDVRTEFLDDIFSALRSEEEKQLELSFLFGSKQTLINGTTDGFELLDGQQRTTTLFLLYWYVNNREQEKLPEFLSHFTYETRDTSTDFLKNITQERFDFKDRKPSDVLKANKWFTDDFNCDPTVCAMLHMLDEIHNKYNDHTISNIASRLQRLKFYVLLLEKFDMNDELYIKMNSRGLSLNPFENFKASIVRYMKKHPQKIYGSDDVVDGKTPYWLDFISKMDARWIDIFWQNPIPQDGNDIQDIIDINDRELGNRYLRFLNRYFYTKAAILRGVKNEKLNDLAYFFSHDCESVEAESRLKGWKHYTELFDLIEEDCQNSTLPSTKYPVFSAIERILETFHENGNKDYIYDCIASDPYGNTKNFDVLEKASYILYHRIVFAATTEFIEAIPEERTFNEDVVRDNYKRMLRVVHNVIENTTIESDVPAVRVIKAISEVIRFEGATTGNFYYSLANNTLGSQNLQLQDEKVKAREMFQGDQFIPEWENAFKEAEKHAFFKGAVSFFFTPDRGCDEFTRRYKIVKELFDENGIAEKYRQQKHILIRAMLSCLNTWNSLKDRYFTENADNKEKYLKMIVARSPQVGKMFCDYFERSTNQSILDYLKDVVDIATVDANENDESFKMLYKRLITDYWSGAIFDEVAKREKKKNDFFRIQNNRSYVILIPGKWFDQLVLDTERHLIIPELINNYGFQYVDSDQKEQINNGNYWGWTVDIKKQLKISNHDYELYLCFNEYKQVKFYISGPNVEDLEKCFDISMNTENERICLPETIPYQLEKNKQDIISKIKEIIEKIKGIENKMTTYF